LLQAPQRAATTSFTRLRTYCDGGFSLLRATLVDGGRQHQIRRHLNSVAHQVVGDTLYGKSRINAFLQAAVSIAIVRRVIVRLL
jgi:23S rRNA-/tRNA-specific pseudouridylate synthase